MPRKIRIRTSSALALLCSLNLMLTAFVIARVYAEPLTTGKPSDPATAEQTLSGGHDDPRIVTTELTMSGRPQNPAEAESVSDKEITPDFLNSANVWEPLDEIPLTRALQQAVFDVCELHGVDMALILGVMERESSFRTEARNDQCWGLMQIHNINYAWLLEDEGIDAATYDGNIRAGALMISRYLEKYDDIHLALMAYNCGERGARKLWRKDIYSTEYSRAVIAASEQWAAVLDTRAQGVNE